MKTNQPYKDLTFKFTSYRSENNQSTSKTQIIPTSLTNQNSIININTSNESSLIQSSKSKKSENEMLFNTTFESKPDSKELFTSLSMNKEKIKNSKKDLEKLRKAQAKRLMTRFNEKEIIELDKEIKELSKKILKEVREIEEDVKNVGGISSNETNKEIKNNMRIYLINEVKSYIKEVQSNQDEYMSKFRVLVGDLNENSYGNTIKNQGTQYFEMKNKEVDESLIKRGEEIDLLVKNISDLNSIMKDFQSLVFEQGTILDRIDINIESALENTVKGHEDLIIADENLKSNCFRNASFALIILIFIEVVLIIFKYIV